jgi:hypothetical protein
LGESQLSSLFRESWGELLGCPNNFWQKKNILKDCWALFSYLLSQYGSLIED